MRGKMFRVLCSTALRVAVWLGFVWGGLVASNDAWAQGTPHRRTVVLRFDFEGSVNEVSRDQLVRRLFEGLASASFEVFSADETVARLYESSPQLKACEDAACFRQIAATLGAHFLVIGKVEAKRRDYAINLRLVYGRTGEVLASASERCDVCGIQEAGDTVNVAAAALRAGLDKVEAPAQVTFETSPSGALVEVDGKPLGFTPLSHEVSAGVHEIVITKPGYVPATRTIEIQPGSTQIVTLGLTAQPGPFSSGAWRAAGWISLGAGILAIAGGAYLSSLQGDLTGCDATGKCEKYENRLASGLLIGGGAAMVSVGGFVLFVAPSVARSSVSANGAAHQSASSWQLVLRGQF